MKRRQFIKNTALTGGLISTGGLFGMDRLFDAPSTFNLNYAPHLGMFQHHAGENPIAQLEFMADQGFRAFEDNGMPNRPLEQQQKIANTLAAKSLEMGVFVAHKIYWNEANLASGDPSKRQEFLEYIKSSIDVAKRVNAKWMTVVPGHRDLSLPIGYQTAHVVESLKQAAGLLEEHGLIMVLEPLNFRDHPGLFLTDSSQAYQICKSVGSPSCKILFDIYHQQIQEGNLIPNIEQCWDEIAYFQIGDNPGRKEPTTGEINYQNIFRFIYEKGYTGILGMEHGNSIPGKAGEQAVLEAYRKVDNFL